VGSCDIYLCYQSNCSVFIASRGLRCVKRGNGLLFDIVKVTAKSQIEEYKYFASGGLRLKNFLVDLSTIYIFGMIMLFNRDSDCRFGKGGRLAKYTLV
jgi:hypothetical protein